jgi:hypothetical protein
MGNENLVHASAEAWCAECASDAGWVTPEEAALMTGSTLRLVYGWVGAGRVHMAEAADGRLRVCLNSPLLC